MTVRPYVAPIKDLYCPSDANAREGTGYDCTPSSYRCCFGDMPGIFCWVAENSSRGAYQRGDKGKKGFESITDGTSNTVLLGEGIVCRMTGSITSGSNVCPPDQYMAHPTKGGIVGVALDPDSSTTSPLALCLAAPKNGSDNKHLFPCKPTSQRWYRMPGGAWHIGGTVMGFVTALPPNSPFCTGTTAGDATGSTVNANDTYSLGSTSSYHPGGSNVAMADGSVRFVSESVDCGNDLSTSFTTLFGTKPAAGWSAVSGQSKWGVWGAMGTANCGESKSL